MGFIIGALKIIFVLGFLVFIHEGGHFIVAKACGISVREFSIGFGPKIYMRQGKETKYTLRLIPFGGYVDMLGESERSDEEGSFSNSSIWKRMAVVVAGATVNIVFGLIVYFSLMAVDFNEVSPIIDSIGSEYAENLIGLQSGDIIKNVNGKNIHLKSDLDEALQNSNDENISLKIQRNNEEKNISVKATKKISKYIGIYFGTSDTATSEIQYVQQNSPAEQAGLKKGDKIIGINDITTNDPNIIVENIVSDEISFKIDRDGDVIDVSVIPENIENFVLGVMLKPADASFQNRVYYGFWESISYIKTLWENIIMLFTGNVQMDQMMGPIGISQAIVQTNGVSQFVYFLSIISLSLGVSNLLPIPALDGGRLLLLIIEAIRRKPLKEELELKIQLLGFSFIILLSLYISFNDILRIF